MASLILQREPYESCKFQFFPVVRLSISGSYNPPSALQEGMSQFQETATHKIGKVNMTHG